ncbi:hypothetical protein [Acetivibrio saccincola]|uniref:Prephenate dehydratase n=1 Tax=Acetivibrio saccincola TaxID=1677857 RepID=A0A2S8R784_9FIRM|nr:hypothetical protein [Acetivibrio saccincola]PQQ65650.1 hypothetical protein B9R14_01935 [Acetivibrio saccincola]
MTTIIEPFERQYKDFINEISSMKNIRIGSLGPHGTSSEQAVKYMIGYLNKINSKCSYKICLMDDFRYVFDALNNKEIEYALIHSAYERITDYFWNHRFSNVLNFIYHTPDYGMIGKVGENYSFKKKVRVAACPAVQGILQYLAGDVLLDTEIEIVTTRSTTEAVLFVLEGKADVGITNETSYELYRDKGIQFISKKYNAHIVWCLFKNNSDENTVQEEGIIKLYADSFGGI